MKRILLEKQKNNTNHSDIQTPATIIECSLASTAHTAPLAVLPLNQLYFVAGTFHGTLSATLHSRSKSGLAKRAVVSDMSEAFDGKRVTRTEIVRLYAEGDGHGDGKHVGPGIHMQSRQLWT